MNEDKAELRDAGRAELGKRGWKARSAGIGRIDEPEGLGSCSRLTSFAVDLGLGAPARKEGLA
jgi:hypothetical protein